MLLIGEGRRGSSCEQSQLCHWYFGRQVARVRKKTLAEERAAAERGLSTRALRRAAGPVNTRGAKPGTLSAAGGIGGRACRETVFPLRNLKWTGPGLVDAAL